MLFHSFQYSFLHLVYLGIYALLAGGLGPAPALATYRHNFLSFLHVFFSSSYLTGVSELSISMR